MLLCASEILSQKEEVNTQDFAYEKKIEALKIKENEYLEQINQIDKAFLEEYETYSYEYPSWQEAEQADGVAELGG